MKQTRAVFSLTGALVIGALGSIASGPGSTAATPALLDGVPRQQQCAPNLVRPDEVFGYRARSGRCEGTYRQEVAAGALSLVHLSAGDDQYVFTEDGSVTIEWNPMGEEPLMVRAVSITPDLFYRMDLVKPASEGSFMWPTNVLAGLELEMLDVGIRGWVERAGDEGKLEIHIPLRIYGEAGAGTADTYMIGVLSEQQLSEVYVTLAPSDGDGHPLPQPIRDGAPLEKGFYPATVPVWFEIRFAELDAPGLYALDVSADVVGGAPTSLGRVIFQHQ